MRRSPKPLALTFDRPAPVWTEALPLGNGSVGAMVFGGVTQERLSLNEESLWLGDETQMGSYQPLGELFLEFPHTDPSHYVRTLSLDDAHPPFQIDGNFGATAGIAELLLQSHTGEVHLLPALPRAWPEGRVTSFRARGGFTVDIAWEAGTLTRATIRASKSGPCRIRYGTQQDTVTLRKGELYTFPREI